METPPHRPINRRFQIFVSSTFKDLAEERKKAIEVIFGRGHIPIALEGFSPRNAADLEVIRNAIADCQVYLLILGHRYGDMVPGSEMSYTELEYNLAQDHQLQTLVFVLRHDEVIQRRKELLDPQKDANELANTNRLWHFHERMRRHFYKPWGPNDEFRYLIANALNDNLWNCEKPGFVPEKEEPTMELLRIASRNEFIVDIVEQLKSFEKLYKRCAEHPDEKRELARFFKQRYLDRIVRHKVTLFFESGSTIAYLAKELGVALRDGVSIDSRGRPSIQISTNNALVYLQLWLRSRVPCTLFPWSPPGDETYGATYGGLEEIGDQDPDYSLPPLDDVAQGEITKLLELPYTLQTLNKPALLLGAASGLQLSGDLKLVFDRELDPQTRENKRQQLEDCRGPHVGSYHNKVFKRFMYKTGIPIIIFLTGDKIDCKIEVGKCHFILDRELSWEQFCRDHAVAFCVGCTQSDERKHADAFRALGFHILEGTGARPTLAFIARNQQFINTFESQTPMAAVT